MSFFFVKMSDGSFESNCLSNCNGYGLCVGGFCVCEVWNFFVNDFGC